MADRGERQAVGERVAVGGAQQPLEGARLVEPEADQPGVGGHHLDRERALVAEALGKAHRQGPGAAAGRPHLGNEHVVDRADEELFGPHLQIIRVRNFTNAIAEANRTRFGLTAGLFSDDAELWREFHFKSRAGVVNWNRPLTGAGPQLPFGGVGCSGNNRPSAFFAADYCSYPVASMEMNSLRMPDQPTPGFES